MAQEKTIDRVAIITLQGDTAEELMQRLTKDGFLVTVVENRGGFLLEPAASLLIGFAQKDVSTLLNHFRDICHVRKRLIPVQPDGALLPALPMMIEAESCGATLFALTVERYLSL